jgi:hypothetical protein
MPTPVYYRIKRCQHQSRWITRNIKKLLYYLPQSQNNFMEKLGLIRNLVTHGEVQLRGVKPSWDH